MVPGEDEPQSKTHNTPETPKSWWGGFKMIFILFFKRKRKNIYIFLK
jgi:hypothetical protein